MKLKAFAKLNLSLAITGRRADGMHELDMLMQNISLADELEIIPADDISLQCEGIPADERNTAIQAARLFFDTAGIRGGARMTLKKNIPAQAGLGGGSSDAGAVLAALNMIYDARLSRREMGQLAVRIGADVPFFLRGGCARARGIGEILTPIRNNCGFSYLLVKPEEGVMTGPAYAKYHALPAVTPDIEAAAAALEEGNRAGYFRAAGNSLLPAGIALCPRVDTILKECMDCGAEFAMMTGSGSCVFAVFPGTDEEERAYAALLGRYPFCARVHNTKEAFEVVEP
ncbi:4-(cytidine 5'-diphospho)-2-C-methyl-D-erythritol kinase [Christensenella intestinihominis]|uniref:4-(cytidine 5'-diphospho)-2-C-methyl-D-erythritol kinase n=1 Tax=Christensenella intestinihominis TaxID=1851429 RepID=UPI00082D3EFC|nr:4-(cytidine 5'-diphospho)-2-C-methyl-D-erythritol kinase [Christensenella intestinihominis]